MTKEIQNPIVIFEGADRTVEVRLDAYQQTIWLSMQQISELFNRDKPGISRHLNNIFKDSELSREAVAPKNITTTADGKIYQVEYVNLDAFISVGYRVDSGRATRFRQWVARILSTRPMEYWTLNPPRFKAGTPEQKACYP